MLMLEVFTVVSHTRSLKISNLRRRKFDASKTAAEITCRPLFPIAERGQEKEVCVIAVQEKKEQCKISAEQVMGIR